MPFVVFDELAIFKCFGFAQLIRCYKNSLFRISLVPGLFFVVELRPFLFSSVVFLPCMMPNLENCLRTIWLRFALLEECGSLKLEEYFQVYFFCLLLVCMIRFIRNSFSRKPLLSYCISELSASSEMQIVLAQSISISMIPFFVENQWFTFTSWVSVFCILMLTVFSNLSCAFFELFHIHVR